MTWNDISVKKWIKISELGSIESSDLGGIIDLISIVYDKDFDEVKNLPINDVVEMRRGVEDLISTPLPVELVKEFSDGGFNFRFADLQKDWILAKNIDLEYYSKDPNNFHICLTILYYPPEEEYTTDKALALSNIIADRPIGQLFPAWTFFFLLSMNCVKITGDYSVLMMMTEWNKILLKGMKNPEVLLPILKKTLLKKLKISGLPTESLTKFQEVVLNSGNMS